MNIHKDTIVKALNPERHSEENVEKALKEFADKRPKDGRLQIIQGAVGSGKSLFIRRYQQVLQPKELQNKTRWAWIDFNAWVEFNTSSDISQRWLCESFIQSFREENPSIDLDFNGRAEGYLLTEHPETKRHLFRGGELGSD